MTRAKTIRTLDLWCLSLSQNIYRGVPRSNTDQVPIIVSHLSPTLQFQIYQMADPVFKSLVALALLACFLLCSSLADASSDVPFILAHKKATLNRLKSGAERLSVTIDIYNQGSSYVPFLLLHSPICFSQI